MPPTPGMPARREEDRVTAFATVADYERRSGVTLEGPQRLQLERLLTDATAELQAAIGQHVSVGTATVELELDAGTTELWLPQQPVRSVDLVAVGGVALAPTAWTHRHGRLRIGHSPWSRAGARDVAVTFTYGYDPVPGELVAWTVVLAAQRLAAARRDGGLGSPEVRSHAISPDGQFNEAFMSPTDGPPAGTLPAQVADQLRSRYGRSVYVIGA